MTNGNYLAISEQVLWQFWRKFFSGFGASFSAFQNNFLGDFRGYLAIFRSKFLGVLGASYFATSELVSELLC